MTNHAANNQKISINNFDMAILCHVKGSFIIGGVARNGQFSEPKATPMGVTGPGSKFIAQVNKLNERIQYALDNEQLRTGDKLLIVGDNNLCAKIYTVMKYAGDTDVETMVEGLTASLINKGHEVRSEYKETLTIFVGLIVGLHNSGILVGAHDIYGSPIDKFVVNATAKDATIPQKLINTKVKVKNGVFADKALKSWQSSLTRISGDFTLVESNGSYFLKWDYLPFKKKCVYECFVDMCKAMPAESTKRASFAAI